MKKLMTLMLGLSLALGSVAVSFGQEPAQEDRQETGKKGNRRRPPPKGRRSLAFRSPKIAGLPVAAIRHLS